MEKNISKKALSAFLQILLSFINTLDSSELQAKTFSTTFFTRRIDLAPLTTHIATNNWALVALLHVPSPLHCALFYRQQEYLIKTY